MGEVRQELAALTGEVAQAVTVEILLGLAHFVADLEQAVDRAALVAHELVDSPGGDGGFAEGFELVGQVAVFFFASFGGAGVALRDEFVEGQAIELVGDLFEVHSLEFGDESLGPARRSLSLAPVGQGP